MAYEITFAPPTRKDLRRLPPEQLDRLLRAAWALANNPRPVGCLMKLAGTAVSRYRIRVGDYRIVYEISDPAQQVFILAIQNRRDVYRG